MYDIDWYMVKTAFVLETIFVVDVPVGPGLFHD